MAENYGETYLDQIPFSQVEDNSLQIPYPLPARDPAAKVVYPPKSTFKFEDMGITSKRAGPRVEGKLKTSPKDSAKVASIKNPTYEDEYKALSNITTKGFDLDLALDEISDVTRKIQERKASEIRDLMAARDATLQAAQPMLDISSMYQLVDAWTGSRMTPGYRPPKGFQSAMENVDEMDKLIQAKGDQMNRIEYDSAKLKLDEALKAEKIKADDELRSLALLLQGRGLQVKENALEQQLKAALQKAAQKKEKELRPLSERTIQALNALKQGNDQLDALYKELVVIEDPHGDPNKKILGKWGGLLNMLYTNSGPTFKSLLGRLEPEQARIASLLNEIAHNYAKAQEGGVLREYDERVKWPNILMTLSEHPDTFLSKTRGVLQKMKDKYRGEMRSYEGLYQTGHIPKDLGPDLPGGKRTGLLPSRGKGGVEYPSKKQTLKPVPKTATKNSYMNSDQYKNLSPERKAALEKIMGKKK